MLELGTGFAFVGRQMRLFVAGEEYFLDLLFYHLKLRCFVVVELKAVPFEAVTGCDSHRASTCYLGLRCRP